MNLPYDTTDAGSQPADVASRWLGRQLTWEQRLTEIRADAAGTPRLPLRRRPPVPNRRVA